MTSASAQDRVEECRLLLRVAEVEMRAAEQQWLAAYQAFLEAKVLSRPGLDVECSEDRSSAERLADRWADRSDA